MKTLLRVIRCNERRWSCRIVRNGGICLDFALLRLRVNSLPVIRRFPNGLKIHFAVHNLKEGCNTIEKFNEFLEKYGIILNDSGGKIKRSPDGGLLQSSTYRPVLPM